MFHRYLDESAAAYPEGEFAVQRDRSITNAETAAQSNRLAHALLALGIEPGDRVAMLSKNSIEHAIAFFGVSKAGAVSVPLNFRLAIPEWKFMIGDCGARVLLASPAYVPAMESIRAELPRVLRFVVMGEGAPAGWMTWDEFLAPYPARPPLVDYSGDLDALQLYTSGTTGLPKGAVLTQAGWSAGKAAAGILMQVEPGSRILLTLPMYHIFGAAVAIGNAHWRSGLYIVEEFQPVEIVRVLEEERIAVAPLVPAMIQACLLPVCGATSRRFEHLRLIPYGASPISVTTLRRAVETFRCGFLQFYGMTELSPISALTPEDHELALRERPELLRSAGRAAPRVEIRIADYRGDPVPNGAVGEILAKGPYLMRGYANQPQATADSVRDGWMHTGDAGYLDDEGFLFIQDRVKDMIVSGGENIYPREVEDALARMPEILDVAVIGIPDEKWGETVLAFVVERPGAGLTEERVIEFCRTQLAGYKRPQAVSFVDALPRNPSGKLLKKQLREPFWKGRERRVAGS